VLVYGATVSYIEEIARKVVEESVPKTLFLMLAVEFCKDTVEDLEECQRIWDFTVVSGMAANY